LFFDAYDCDGHDGRRIQFHRQNDDILLVAGDSDYVPVVAKLIERGFKVEVAFGARRHGNFAKWL
jgi:uncharacterized LabA/DUF88 family protein